MRHLLFSVQRSRFTASSRPPAPQPAKLGSHLGAGAGAEALSFRRGGLYRDAGTPRGWPTFASPRLRLPHASRCSKRGHHRARPEVHQVKSCALCSVLKHFAYRLDPIVLGRPRSPLHHPQLLAAALLGSRGNRDLFVAGAGAGAEALPFRGGGLYRDAGTPPFAGQRTRAWQRATEGQAAAKRGRLIPSSVVPTLRTPRSVGQPQPW